MLASTRSAGIVPEVNLRSPLHAGDKLFKQGSTLILKPVQMLNVQNRGIAGPTKRIDVLQKI